MEIKNWTYCLDIHAECSNASSAHPTLFLKRSTCLRNWLMASNGVLWKKHRRHTFQRKYINAFKGMRLSITLKIKGNLNYWLEAHSSSRLYKAFWGKKYHFLCRQSWTREALPQSCSSDYVFLLGIVLPAWKYSLRIFGNISKTWQNFHVLVIVYIYIYMGLK